MDKACKLVLCLLKTKSCLFYDLRRKVTLRPKLIMETKSLGEGSFFSDFLVYRISGIMRHNQKSPPGLCLIVLKT